MHGKQFRYLFQLLVGELSQFLMQFAIEYPRLNLANEHRRIERFTHGRRRSTVASIPNLSKISRCMRPNSPNSSALRDIAPGILSYHTTCLQPVRRLTGYNRYVKSALVLAAVLCLAGCSKNIDTPEAVKEGVINDIAKKGMDVKAMDISVDSVSFRAKEADAVVSFRPKGAAPGSQGVTMNYTLDRDGDAWKIKSRNMEGHNQQQPPGSSALPPGHPTSTSGNGAALPPGHPQVTPGQKQ